MVLLVNVILLYYYIIYGLSYRIGTETIIFTLLLLVVLIIINFLVIQLIYNKKRALFISGTIVVISFISTIFVLIIIVVNQANQYERNRLNQYPTLIQIDKNKKTLNNKFAFDLNESYIHQQRVIGIPNMYLTSFTTKDDITELDFKYLINWLRNIEPIPYYIELRYQDIAIYSIYNLDGSLSYCYPRTNGICKDMDLYQWKPVISAIKEEFFSYQFPQFEDKKSNGMSDDSILKLYFRTNQVEMDDFKILVKIINEIIVKQPIIQKGILFEIEYIQTGNIISFQIEADENSSFSFDKATITSCEILDVCENIEKSKR